MRGHGPSTPDGPAPADGPGPRSAWLDSLACAAYLADGQGIITAVNPMAEQLLDRSAAELLGQDAHQALHRNALGQPAPRSECPIRQAALANRTTQGGELWFERGDGSVAPVAWLVTGYDDGTRQGTVALFHPLDDTEAGSLQDPLSELERLALFAELTTQLTSTMDAEEVTNRLVRLLVPRLADWAVVDLITEAGEVWRRAVVHVEDGDLKNQEHLVGPMPAVPQESQLPLSRALRGAASALAGPETYQGEPDSGIAVEQGRLFAATGIQSAIIGPIHGLRDVLGALTLGRCEDSHPFTTADLPLLEEITRRAGLALDNARLYERQRKVSETMQRHLLPQLPRVPDLQMTARYVPAPDASQVGGDWYDAFVLPDGATALVIGDVVGHDLDAAADMAQLRNMLRAYAFSQQKPPSKIVEWLDQAAMQLSGTDMATLVLARLTNVGSLGWELTWTNAGHPPPLFITHEGVTQYLTDGHGMLLGTGLWEPRPDASLLLPPGATLLLYTDGLVEEPGASLDEGLDRLSRQAAAISHHSLDTFTDQLLARARPAANEDDIALLALRTTDPARRSQHSSKRSQPRRSQLGG
ncbi:SpoIIE family protein phosphatase [Streptomyces sp. NPDC006617]|uniref:SpoIIE family protein phosphatase n=1 Tax=Streptomyces sp. NPDC006617 TaxID=3155354 RepID=UPI0033ADF0A5